MFLTLCRSEVLFYDVLLALCLSELSFYDVILTVALQNLRILHGLLSHGVKNDVFFSTKLGMGESKIMEKRQSGLNVAFGDVDFAACFKHFGVQECCFMAFV